MSGNSEDVERMNIGFSFLTFRNKEEEQYRIIVWRDNRLKSLGVFLGQMRTEHVCRKRRKSY